MTAPASTAPTGLWAVKLDGGSGPDNHALFWFLAYGATIHFDRDIYNLEDTAVLTYAVTPAAYWDTATYNYAVSILDIYGTEKWSQAISAASGTVSHVLDSATFEGNDFIYGAIKRTRKSDGVVDYMASDSADISAYLTLYGYTMNETASIVPYVNVSAAQSTGTICNDSTATGYYSMTGMVKDVAMWTNASLNTYLNDTHLWTPLTAKAIQRNITLINSSYNPPTPNIGGIIYTSNYYQPIESAAVYITKSGYANNMLSNIAGFYDFAGLFPNTTYNLSAWKVNYVNSTPEAVWSGVT